jgi:hypothetical protein
VHATSDHYVYYSIAPCGWGNIYDINTGVRVGGANLIAAGRIGGLYGWYTLTVRNALSVVECDGSISGG